MMILLPGDLNSTAMTKTHNDHVRDLREGVVAFVDTQGEAACKDVEKKSAPLMWWLGYLHKYHLTGTADSLFAATGSSIRETAACLSLGLTRPAIFSLRAQIDLTLAWLYFKDHPVEWRLVNRSGDGFKMKKEILEYLATNYPGFKARLPMLKIIKTRNEDEPYRLLSAHIHGQSEVVLPSVHALADLVGAWSQVSEAAKLCFEVAEYLGDILLATYATSWEALPAKIRSSAMARFTSEAQKKEFFSY